MRIFWVHSVNSEQIFYIYDVWIILNTGRRVKITTSPRVGMCTFAKILKINCRKGSSLPSQPGTMTKDLTFEKFHQACMKYLAFHRVGWCTFETPGARGSGLGASPGRNSYQSDYHHIYNRKDPYCWLLRNFLSGNGHSWLAMLHGSMCRNGVFKIILQNQLHSRFHWWIW